MSNLYYVEIVEDETGEVCTSMGPMGIHRANKVEEGAGINLDWDNFHTRIVNEDGDTVDDDGRLMTNVSS